MTLMPAEVVLCAVNYGPAVSFTGQGGTIRARLRADQPVIHEATGIRLHDAHDALTANPGAPLQFNVPVVDQAGFVKPNGDPVTDWSYILEGTITFGSKVRQTFSRTFAPVTGDATLDIDLHGTDTEATR